jgi:hypothetical protein
LFYHLRKKIFIKKDDTTEIIRNLLQSEKNTNVLIWESKVRVTIRTKLEWVLSLLV